MSAVLITAALSAVGCGSGSSTNSTATAPQSAPDTVNASQVEQGIEKDLSTSAVKLTNVSCPSDEPIQTGATFTCSVSLSNGGSGKVTVTQQGVNRYTYAITPGSVQIPGTAAAATIEQSLAAQGAANAKVTCPQNIIVKIGTTVTCDVSGAQGAAAGNVTFTFSESNGTVDPASVKTS
jgi:hypothetical protein